MIIKLAIIVFNSILKDDFLRSKKTDYSRFDLGTTAGRRADTAAFVCRRVVAILALMVSCGAPGLAHAMTVEVQGRFVFATGPVVDDVLKFEEAFAKPGVDTVVFVNSPGGDLWTGLRVGRMIADKKLKTVTAGSCVSACSIMFMGGVERTFSDAFRPNATFVGIHGAHDAITKSVDPIRQPQIFAFYKHNMGERFHAEVMNKALYDMEDAGALLRVFDAARFPKRVPYHCKSNQTLRSACTEFAAHDALTLGIVTSNAFTSIDLPQAFKLIPRVLGQELLATVSDPTAYLQAVSDSYCAGDACRKLVSDFNGIRFNKALAIPVDSKGVGTAGNRNTPDLAFLGAIYLCNHIRDQPARLCEAQVVNGYDVRGFYATGTASHVQALADLKVPPEKFYANEEYGGAMTRADGLRTSKYNDITPQKLDGVRVYGTQELAAALKSPSAPVLIDVLAAAVESLPGALTLRNGGLAFDAPATDAAFESRFAGLMKLLAPDPTRPVVFYCASRDLWMSVNAALRAKKLGYTQVGWYRGGIDSWKAANLPLASVVIRAVAN